MNWTLLAILTFVGLTAADYGWKPGQQYRYNIEARTVAGLHQVANQFTGSFIRGKLQVNVDSENQLTLQVQDAKYAETNRKMDEGWATQLPENEVNYKGLPAKNQPFQIHLSNGVVQKMVVDKDIPTWEVNFFKGIASQFQVDTQGKNLRESKFNSVPLGDQDSGVFSTMEESINGKYETNYDISVLPEYVLQSRPELAPLEHLKGDGEHYRIVKTRNFSNSDQHIVYRYGMSGHEGWSEGSNTMGNFLARTSQSTIVYSGKHNRYTIQSTETTEKVLVAPHLYNDQKGIVVSRVNLTLEEVTSSKGSSPAINNPRTLESLAYEYQQGNPQNRDSGEGSSSSSSEGSSQGGSSSSSEEEQAASFKQGNKRNIRSAEWSKTNILMNNKYDSSSGSSSSSDSSISSSEEYLETAPNLNGSPYIEFFPDVYANPTHSSEQKVQQIVRFARQIGQTFNNPSNMIAEDTLNMYGILTRLVVISNTEELRQATDKLYYSEEKLQESGKTDAYQNYKSWQAYRDAVAAAGSGPALVTMSSWIKSGQVKKNEAAQLLAVLPKLSRYPTTEYMNYFFELVKSKEVQSQKYLNVSAVLSFTDLVRRSQVDSQSSHHRYPIHISGTQSHNHYAVVEEQYIPYFQRQLENAIAQEDSQKIQVNIRALGNIAHSKILAVFEPYLEGVRPVTDFHRFLMVSYLDHLVKVHPNLSRSVLFKIYTNQGEVPVVRIAAVNQIMKTNPPVQILQRMAEQTNYDQSKHVTAAVKSVILSVAQGQYNADQEFVQNAGYVSNFLTPENFGRQYSHNFVKAFIANEPNNLYFEHNLGSVNGYDGSYPNSIMYHVDQKLGGYDPEPLTVNFMSSTSEGFLNLLFDQFNNGNNQKMSPKQRKNSEYSYKKINQILNGEYDEPLQVEANLFFSVFGGERYYAFDNHSIEQIPEFFDYVNEKLQQGVNSRESKFYNPFNVELGFPMVAGVHFTYSYNEPSMAHIGVQAKGHFKQNQESNDNNQIAISASMDGEYQVIWAKLKIGKMGFVAPYSEQRHIAAAAEDVCTNIQLKGEVQYHGQNNTFKANIQPSSHGNHQQKLVQYATHIYTTYQNINDNTPYNKGKNALTAYTGPNKMYQTTVGKEHTGYEFQVEARSENHFSEILKAFDAIKRKDFSYFLSSGFHNFKHALTNNYYAISYNPKNSSPQPTEFSLYYNSTVQGTEYRPTDQKVRHLHRRAQSSSNMAQPSDEESRIYQLLANAQSGIQDAQASVFDAFVSFAGKQNNGRYSFTAVHADSPVSEKSRFLAYISGRPYQESQKAESFQAAVHVDFKQPQVPIFNYKQAYEANPTSYVLGQINFDQNGNSRIDFEGKMQQTEARKQYLKQHPYSAVCEKQMQQGNYILPACFNASQNANVLNKYDFSVKYNNVPQRVQKAFFKIYDFIRHWGYQYNQENFFGVKNPEGTIKLSARFSENLNFMNSSLEAPSFTSDFENITVHHLLQPFLVQSPAYNQLHFFSPNYFYSTPYATCAVDNNEVSTFNNRSYPIELGDCYHVLVMSTPNQYQYGSQESSEYNNQFDYAILAKESSSQKKEVQVLLGDDVVTLEPTGSTGVTVKANGENIPISDNKIAKWENGQNKLQVHTLPGRNNAVLYFSGHELQVYYDDRRVAIMLPNSYRNKVRGLCGTFDGEPFNDFTTSANCMANNHQQFTASYAVADESCKGPSKEYIRQAKNEECYRKEVVYNNVVSDAEAGRRFRKVSAPRNNTVRSKQGKKGQSGCTSYQPQIVQDGENTCFSLQPQPICNNNCKATRKVERTVDFHCAPFSDNLTVHWLGLLKKGANPDFSQKTSTKRMKVLVPENCVAK